jgi:hypothetical protein
MNHITCKIAKEILEQKKEQDLNEKIKEACLKDKSHMERLTE